MTDAEVICAFMEPKPKWSADPGSITNGGWWWMGAKAWEPAELCLDELHKVEARLIDMHKARYYDMELRETGVCWLWHAPPEQRIKALAAVLRGKEVN